MSKILVEQDFIDAAKKLRCEIASVKAVAEIESRGNGFYADGLNMLPKFAVDNIFNRLATQFILFCQAIPLRSAFAQFTDFQNLLCGQFCSAILLAAFINQSEMMFFALVCMSFLSAVAVVVQMRSKKQMLWIDAYSIITSMTNKFIHWVKTRMDKKSNTVREPSIILIPKSAVSVRMLFKLPIPTTIILNFYIRLKAFQVLLGKQNQITIKMSHRFLLLTSKLFVVRLVREVQTHVRAVSILTQNAFIPNKMEVFS